MSVREVKCKAPSTVLRTGFSAMEELAFFNLIEIFYKEVHFKPEKQLNKSWVQTKCSVYCCYCYMKMFLIWFPDIDECASAPCHNRGTCVDSRNGYNCSCVPGYSGANCETGKTVYS